MSLTTKQLHNTPKSHFERRPRTGELPTWFCDECDTWKDDDHFYRMKAAGVVPWVCPECFAGHPGD